MPFEMPAFGSSTPPEWLTSPLAVKSLGIMNSVDFPVEIVEKVFSDVAPELEKNNLGLEDPQYWATIVRAFAELTVVDPITDLRDWLALLDASDTNNDTLVGLADDDILSGSGGDDKLYGENGNDKLYGGSGDDLLSGGWGFDLLDGGKDTDTVDYSFYTDSDGLKVDLGSGKVTFRPEHSYGSPPAFETVVGIENVDGGGGDDVLTGNAGDNVLRGGGGDDTLAGGGGKDTLVGGPGADVFNVIDPQDVVLDFNISEGDTYYP